MSSVLAPSRDLPDSSQSLSQYSYAFGKRKDKLGWDVLSILNGKISFHGPYKTRRAASMAITLGDVAKERAAQDALDLQ